MKRSRPNEPKRFDELVAQIGALSRDEMGELVLTAKKMFREACGLVTAQIPDDVWRLVIAEWGKKLDRLCLMACVSRAWCHRITQHIRLTMADKKLTDARILFKFPEVQELTLSYRTSIRDCDLAQLTHLTGLCLHEDGEISTKGLQELRQLRTLELVGACNGIAGKAIRNHIHLRSLKLCGTNKHLGDGCFEKLVRLTSLDLCNNKHVTDKPLRAQWGLLHLGLAKNVKITDAGISHMRSLTSLDLRENGIITGDVLRTMTQLTALNLTCNTGIDSGTALVPLASSLQRLWLTENTRIDPMSLVEMTQLRHLCLYGNNQIQGWVLPRLTNLETLVIGARTQFMPSQLTALVNLRHLVLTSGNPVTTHQLEKLALMPHLERISVTWHGETSLEPLKEVRPDMKIDRIRADRILNEWQGEL